MFYCALLRFLFLQFLDRAFENFVPPLTQPLDSRPDGNVRLNADALELTTVAVADVDAGEIDEDATRKDGARHIAVRSGRRASDENGVRSLFQEEACVFGLADGLFVDENDELPFITPRAARLRRRIDDITERNVQSRSGVKLLALEAGDHGFLFGQTRSDRPDRPADSPSCP